MKRSDKKSSQTNIRSQLIHALWYLWQRSNFLVTDSTLPDTALHGRRIRLNRQTETRKALLAYKAFSPWAQSVKQKCIWFFADWKRNTTRNEILRNETDGDWNRTEVAVLTFRFVRTCSHKYHNMNSCRISGGGKNQIMQKPQMHHTDFTLSLVFQFLL